MMSDARGTKQTFFEESHSRAHILKALEYVVNNTVPQNNERPTHGFF